MPLFPPNHLLQGIDSEISQEHNLDGSCNGEILTVAIRPISALWVRQTTKSDLFSAKYNSACLGNDDEDKPEVQEEIEDMVYECAWRTFVSLAPAITSPEPPLDLHTHLDPDTFYHRLDMVKGKIGFVKESEPPSSPPFTLAIGDAFNLQRYLTRDIIVQEKFSSCRIYSKRCSKWAGGVFQD